MSLNKGKRPSKFLSLVLRHRPEHIGIQINAHGWTDVELLLDQLGKHGLMLSRDDLDKIVAENNKKRFSYSEDGKSIRANQGHSIKVDLQLKKKTPPWILYHGTTVERWKEIKKTGGLSKMNRHHVHLSADKETAINVGSRHRGRTVILVIETPLMIAKGYDFFMSDNGVWLVDEVPNQFIVEV